MFAATDRRLLVALEARVLTEDLRGGFGECFQVECELSLVFAEALYCRIRQARQAVEIKAPVELAEALSRCV